MKYLVLVLMLLSGYTGLGLYRALHAPSTNPRPAHSVFRNFPVGAQTPRVPFPV